MLYSCILSVPILVSCGIFFGGHLIGINGSSILSGFGSLFFFFLTLIVLYIYLYNGETVIFDLGVWFQSDILITNWVFVFDSLSIVMLTLISSVSLAVQWYSFNYMASDPFLAKFLAYLSLFTWFMVILVLSSDLLIFLIGWEGVGLCSFLLISFWNNRISACKGALKAVIFNRIGDLGLLWSLVLVGIYVQSFDLHVLYTILPFFDNVYVTFFGGALNVRLLNLFFLGILVGVTGKSAQLGLHVWLLDAMEGPTPVSALIHAATMVTAGVYLLIRLSFIVEFVWNMQIWIAVLGSLTTIVSSLVGCYQTDLKSIIAYSTCSQLGYMVAACGFSAYYASFFHLFTHGFFKALLFLSAGVIIHNLREEQDIRQMGSLFYLFPLTFSFFLVGSGSLMGLPFLSGFYSKDKILELMSSLPFFWSNMVFSVCLLAVLFTTWYSLRVIYYVFLVKTGLKKGNASFIREKYSVLMLIGMVFLSLCSIFLGFFLVEIFAGHGSNFFYTSIYCSSLKSNWALYSDFFFLQSTGFFVSLKLYPVYFICCGFIFFIFHLLKVSKNFFFTLIYQNPLYFYLYSLFFNGLFFNYMYISFFLSFFFKSCVEISKFELLSVGFMPRFLNLILLVLTDWHNRFIQPRFYLSYVYGLVYVTVMVGCFFFLI